MRLAALLAVFCLSGSALAACGDSSPTTPATVYKGDEKLPNGMTIKESIEARQHNLKDLGGAFKAINDQLKLGQPNMQEIGFSAQEVRNHSQDIGSWFQPGTGPSSGVKTEALEKIWEDPAGYAKVVDGFKTAATALNDAALAGDRAALDAAARQTGGTCKACHDGYRIEQD